MAQSEEGTTHVVAMSLPRDTAQTIASALTELLWPPADAVGLFDNEDGTWRVDASFTSQPDKAGLELFLNVHGAGDIELYYSEVPPADWVTISQSGLHPVRAGRFIVYGRHDRYSMRRFRWSIEVDAGQAFGTAHHGSTLGCLLAIDDLAKKARVDTVLDLGTGTGVLAIAAAKVWPARVVASDFDPVAVETARHNIQLNRARTHVEVLLADGLAAARIRQSAPFDLVIANILANPLVVMSKEIARATRAGSNVVLSGITKEQAEGVAAAYRAAGFTRLRRYFVSGWATLVLQRAS